jgi:hypothetical protein
MRENNWLHHKINQRPDYILLGGILLFCLTYRVFYFKFGIHNVWYNSDSVSYFTAINIFNGIIDLYRTPVYPFIIGFFEYLSRDHFIRNLIFFQQVMSFLSIIPFYFISKGIVKNKYMVTITTIIYGCLPLLIYQNVKINPECLSIVGSTLVLFLFVRYVNKPTKFSAISIGFFPFVLIMLKPTYLILLCLVLIFFIVRFIFFRQEKTILYWGIFGWFIAAVGVLGYCEMNKKYNGEFVLSKTTLNNNLANIVISGAYKQGEDKELITLIDTTKQSGYYFSAFIVNNECIDNYKLCYNKFPKYLMPMGDMTFVSSIPNTVNYSSERIILFVKKSQHSIIYTKYIFNQVINIIMYDKILSLILILQSIAIIFVFFRHKKVAWIHILSVLFIVGQFFTIALGAIGAIDEWGRLLIPSYPFIILIIASFVRIIISSLDIKKLIEIININYE